jgi:hypothetical protein
MTDLICAKESPGKGLGVFALRDIKKDELIAEFTGPLVTVRSFDGIPPEVVEHLFNVGPDRYIMAREPAVRTNHSCEPNAGITNDRFLIAMRDIGKGEEVTFDYSMIIADDWTLECQCGTPSCRRTIGRYSALPEDLKQRYAPYTPEWIKKL